MTRTRRAALPIVGLWAALGCTTTPPPALPEWRPLPAEPAPAADALARDRSQFLGHVDGLMEDRLHRADRQQRLSRLLYGLGGAVVLMQLVWGDPDAASMGLVYALPLFGGGIALQRTAAQHERCGQFLDEARRAFGRKWPGDNSVTEPAAWREYRRDQDTITQSGPC